MDLKKEKMELLQGDTLHKLSKLVMEGRRFQACITDPPYMLNFMSRKWDRAEAPPIDADFANWLAGFVDGEGCFSVHKKCVNGCETYDCQFSITLRADDKPIVLEIQRRLGGIGSVADRPPPAPNSGPQVRYCISSQRDCIILREIFTTFPLRAKKRRDFEAWAYALDCWLAHKPSVWDDMAYYRDALMAVKKYGSTFSSEQLFHYRWARLAFDVLLPGAYLACFGGTRTFHRMACAIEDAGFEIRDTVCWLYGTGMPKSYDIAQSIEKLRTTGKARRPDRDLGGLSRNRFSGSEEGTLIANTGGKLPLTHPDAQAWEGWGTALKPGFEPIILARKPLIGTVADNVLTHGVGGLNIDACRVPCESRPLRVLDAKPEANGVVYAGRREFGHGFDGGSKAVGETALGRWPANVIHDGSEEVLECFPEAKGQLAPIKGTEPSVPHKNVYGRIARHAERYEPRSDSGSAARFFYCSKATKVERMGSVHPTVKPISLLRYLCRLITPPGGTILDPFAGTGTLAQAAHEEGFDAVLIEREEEYCADIRRRFEAMGLSENAA